jgi:hypothetical protein
MYADKPDRCSMSASRSQQPGIVETVTHVRFDGSIPQSAGTTLQSKGSKPELAFVLFRHVMPPCTVRVQKIQLLGAWAMQVRQQNQSF